MFDEVVECPYCNHENDMSDGLIDLSADQRFDHECENCEEEFEVFVEFYPIYKSAKIEYIKCEECEKVTRDVFQRGKVFPYPKTLKSDKVCRSCYHKAMIAECCET